MRALREPKEGGRPLRGASIAALARGDLAAVADLHALCFEDPWSERQVERLLAMEGAFGLKALCAPDPRLKAFAIGRAIAGEGEILSLAVTPGARGAGLGAALLRRALDAASIRGARAIFLEVAVDNFAATRLYRSAGFVEVGRRRGYYHRLGEPPADALTMKRSMGD